MNSGNRIGKRKIKYLIQPLITLFVIFVLFWTDISLSASDKEVQDAVLLMEVMTDSNVNTKKVVLQHGGHGIMVDKYQSKQKFYSMKEKVEGTFSISMTLVTPKSQKDHIEYRGELSLSPSTQMVVVWAGHSEGDTSDTLRYSTYMMVNISGEGLNQKEIDKYYTFLNDKLKELRITPKINTSIQGEIDREMDNDEQYRLLKSMFEKLNGSVVEGINLELVISLSGYSKKISRYVMSKGEQVNVQIAARYDSLHEKTIVTIGNPIITMEY